MRLRRKSPKATPNPTPTIQIKGFPNLTVEPRADAYGRIITAVKLEFDLWLRANPALAGDERNQRALEESIKGLATIFDILDDYELKHRGGLLNLAGDEVAS